MGATLYNFVIKPMTLLCVAAILFTGSLLGSDFDIQTQITAFRNPFAPASLPTVIPTLAALIAAVLSILGFFRKGLSAKDLKPIEDSLQTVEEKVVEGRTITQAEHAKTRLAQEDQTEALLARLDQLEETLSPDEVRDLESAIADILNSADKRKAPAQQALADGDIEAAGDHLMKVGRQEQAAADDIAKSSRETYREAGALFYTINTAKALHTYQACIDAGSTQVWDHIYLARLNERAGHLTTCRTVLETARGYADDQRDRSVILDDFGDVARRQGKLDNAHTFYDDGLTIAKALAKADPSNAQKQRDLSISYDRLGDVARDQGRLDDARTFYADGLTIAKALAKADPSNAQKQRDLSVSYNQLGDVARDQGKLDDARTLYADGLKIRKPLAKADTSNAQNQRDLTISYAKLAQLGGKEAIKYWKSAQEIVEALSEDNRLNPRDQWMLQHIPSEIARLESSND